MKLSTIKKIIVEDFPQDLRGWLPKLATPLNSFLEQVYKVLAKGITISDNLKAEKTTLTVFAGEETKSIRWSLNERPSLVLLGSATYSDGNIPVTQITINWVYSNGQILVTFYGLDGVSKYRVTIVGVV